MCQVIQSVIWEGEATKWTPEGIVTDPGVLSFLLVNGQEIKVDLSALSEIGLTEYCIDS